MEGRRDTEFARWLRKSLADQEKSVRGLARDIARVSAGGDSDRNVETVRRALNKYLLEGRQPSFQMRRSIASALSVPESELPDDEEGDAMAALEAISREQRALSQRLARLGRAIGARAA